jgi:PAS domain-containing protein
MMEMPFVPAEYVSLFFNLFENSSDVVFLARVRDRVVLDANGATLSMFKLTREEAIGRSADELAVLVRPNELDDLLHEVTATGKMGRRPVRFRTRWSEEFTLELSATLAHLRGEDVILGIGTLPRGPLSSRGDRPHESEVADGAATGRSSN